MRRTKRICLAAGLLVALVAGPVLARRERMDASGAVAPSVGSSLVQEERERELAFFTERARQDPHSAIDRTRLAGVFLQRARETGSFEDFLRAERTARESLALRVARNEGALSVLVSSLVAQHRFTEALEAAEALVAAEPERPSFRATLGEIQLELGRYDEAARTFASLEPSSDDLAVAPRLARWAELSGRPRDAARHLYAASRTAAARPDLPREQVAWFHLRVGDFELRRGRLDEADAALRAGLAVHPDDYRILALRARLAAARGEWEEAAGTAERALAATFEPSLLALLAEVHEARGDSAAAAEYTATFLVSIQSQTGELHRDWSLFLLDHGLRTDEVLAQARRGLETRRDVYGYDLVAWALHRAGRHREAREAMRGALRLDTRDAMLLYHAGMIERALGDFGAAERLLARALEINGSFHPVHAPAAGDALRELRGAEPWYRKMATLLGD